LEKNVDGIWMSDHGGGRDEEDSWWVVGVLEVMHCCDHLIDRIRNNAKAKQEVGQEGQEEICSRFILFIHRNRK
jgi:hypothetical protein